MFIDNHTRKLDTLSQKNQTLKDFSLISSFQISLDEFDLLKLSDYRSINELQSKIRELKATSLLDIGLICDMNLDEDCRWFITAIKEEVDVMIFSGKVPKDIFDCLHGDLLRTTQTMFVPIIESPKAARKLHAYWLAKYQIVPAAFIMEKGNENLNYSMPSFNMHQHLLKLYENKVVYHHRLNRPFPIITQEGVYTSEAI